LEKEETTKQLIVEILKHEGAATIVTSDVNGPYVTATWNSYIAQDENGNFLIPVGGYHQTESNIKNGSNVIILIASKQVTGKEGLGAGFRLTGSATFLSEGTIFKKTKKRFSWIRAVVMIGIDQIEQLR